MHCMKTESGDGFVDTFTSIIVIAFLATMTNIIHFLNFKMRHGLCELANHCKSTTSKKSTLKPFIFTIGLFAVAFTFNSFHVGILIRKCFDLTVIDVIPYQIIQWITALFGMFPLMIAFIITLEISGSLAYQIEDLKQDIKMNLESSLILKRILEMSRIFENVRSLLSNNLFWIMTKLS